VGTTQREKMRELFRTLGGAEDLVIRAYANAEARGEVRRKSNEHGLDAETYAQALYKDGINKGWIRG